MSQSIGTLVIFGVTGDLSSRLLLPALGQLLTHEPKRRFKLIGVGNESWDDDKLAQVVKKSFATVNAKGAGVTALLKNSSFIEADVTQEEALRGILDEVDGVPAIYFALPPAVTEESCKVLDEIGMPEGSVLALEKPYGTDQKSAHALSELLERIVPADHIFRVDHFLGSSTVLNILGMRFTNRIFEPLWNRNHIEKVDIIWDETLGLEGRAGYYDHAGALVDMIQSHLLQVLAVFAMEPPLTIGADDVREGRFRVLKETHLFDDDPEAHSRRARYAAGKVGRRKLPNYWDEDGVDPDRHTETLTEVAVEVQNWRWAGVPFTLRSGKALGADRMEIVVTFKPVPHMPEGFKGDIGVDKLRISLGPEQLFLDINVNGPGDTFTIERTELKADFGDNSLLAYSEVLSSILDSDPLVSVRGDSAEQCWRIIQPVIDAWQQDRVPLQQYAAGSTGPATWAPLG